MPPEILTTRNGQPISQLGLGTVKLGRNEQVKYPQTFNIPDDITAKKLLSTAFSLGINIIDTAPAYGQSEERLGQLLLNDRHQWHIVTKVGEEFDNGQSYFDFSKKHIRFSIERSLKRLRTDYLDTVLIHSNGNDIDIIQQDGALDTLLAIKREGLIRYIGMSTKTIEGGLLALNHSDIVMASYSLRYMEQEPVLKQAETLSKAIFIKKGFDSGYVSSAEAISTTFKKIFAFPAVASMIIGTINRQHLENNIALLQATKS